MRIGPRIDFLRPYPNGPITLQAFKIKRALDPAIGELTSQGEIYHSEQRKTMDELRKEAVEHGRQLANAEQNSSMGAFPETNKFKWKSARNLGENDGGEDDEGGELTLLDGIYR
jgi:hypothetical protein